MVAQRPALAAVGGRVDAPSKRKKPKAGKMLKKRAAHPPSAARFVGRRSRDELDHHEHDSVKHLRQHGFESPEKPCVAIADERIKDLLGHAAHSAPPE
jgi:hypothetical protein